MLARSVFIAFSSLLPIAALAQSSPRTEPRHPVLVELFTSEGCSSCPPADALLARLDTQQPIPSAEIIVLGEHVDYWDSLGWRDRFSSPLMTERQRRYGQSFHLSDIYTPQMVIGGVRQINGADASAASRAIVQAALVSSLPLTLDPIQRDGDTLLATLHLASEPATDADLYAAVVTPAIATQVKKGENGGKTLQHVGVVRSLTRIGSLRALASRPLSFRVAMPDGTQPARIVIFAQSPNQGPILGAIATPVPASTPHVAAAQLPR